MKSCLLIGLLGGGLFAGGLRAESPPSEGEREPTVAAELVLVNPDRVHDVRIVVARDTLPTPKVAAKELQRLVEIATGVRWPIQEEISTEGINIIIGPHPLLEKERINVEELPSEGYRLVARGSNLFIVGRDTDGDPWDMHWMRACQTGTLFGVIDFARIFFHARWLSPGEAGEILTPIKRLVIPAGFDYRDGPGFASRRILMDSNQPEIARYMRFNRLGWSYVSCYWHNWYQTINPEVFSKDHPEWFAQVHGVRATHMRNKTYDGQLCLSNKEVAKKMADIAVASFQQNPSATMFSISENDGGNHCECEQCRELDVEEWVPGMPSLSERFARFANEVQRQIDKRAPGLHLGYYAYHQGEKPPVKTKLLPGIFVSDVCNGYDVHYNWPEHRRNRVSMMKKWRESGASISMVTYFHGMSWWSLPMFAPEALAELIKTAALYKSSTGFTLGLTDRGFGVSGNEFFLASELMWNPRGDVSAILDDYYSTGFGPAAEFVRHYFDRIRVSFAAAAMELPISADEKRPDSWVLATYDPIRIEADVLIASALKAVEESPDEGLRSRVRSVADGWRWTKIQCDVLRGVKAYRAHPSKERAKQMMELISIRETFLKEQAGMNNYAVSLKDIEGADKNFSFPVNRSEYEMAFAGEVKSVRVSLLEGNKMEPLVTMEENREGKVADEMTQVKISATKDALRFAVEAKDSNSDRLLANVKERDGEVWKDDVVEVFLKPDRRSDAVYHILVNPAGTVTDMRHQGESTPDLFWNSDAKVAVARKPDGWCADIVVPFSAMNLKSAPLPGDIWGLNVTRSRRNAGVELSAWSPTFGLFLRPERFGELIFTNSAK